MSATVQVTCEIARRFREFHDADTSLFHVVLDDLNFGDGHADSCIERAPAGEGMALARLLRAMSKTQRRKLVRLMWDNSPAGSR